MGKTALAGYALVQTALFTLWAAQSGLRSWSSMMAAGLSLLNALVFCLLSYLEHARNKQPSTTLLMYLLFSTVFNAVRSRTLWLAARNSALTRLFTASVVFQALVLVLESGEKAKYLPAEMSKRRPEETSSILNRGIFYWLNQLMIKGSRNLLFPDDLYELDEKMTAEYLATSYIKHWQQSVKTKKYAAMLNTAKTLKWQMLAVIPPRIALLVFTVCQPILIQELLSYLSAPEVPASNSIGYGLIGAYALVYTGSAIATGFYWHFQYRFLTMVRGCLVSAISWQTTRLNLLAVSDSKAALTLMSADVERITDGLRPLHDFWASIIQIGIALYLLEGQMGVACVVPIVIAIICAVSTAWLSGPSNLRQVKWMEAVQKRISITSAMLLSMKGVKMRGLVGILTSMIQDSRLREIKVANAWRTLLLWNVGFSFIPEYLSPVTTFMVYIIQARTSGSVFDAARAFTTVSLLIIMNQPLNSLLQALPGLVSAVGCFRRIGEFLTAEEQEDFRDCMAYSMRATERDAVLADDATAIELTTNVTKHSSMQRNEEPSIIRVTDGFFGWEKDEATLKDINISIPRGRLTCVVGPVASGKSTLCKVLLGETRVSKGQVEMFTHSKEIAFCEQTSHLINGTIKENIIGFSEADTTWYETVLRACALEEDVSAMPKGHDTVVGSSGISLSGGQRQKIAIARAIYARKPIIILDDVFSGLDAGSEQQVFRNAVGPDGLARKHGATVIFATHAIKFLPYTDHVIALDLVGKVAQEGPYDLLRKQPGYIRSLAMASGSSGQGQSDNQADLEIETFKVAEQATEEDLSRQLGDFSIYRFYFKAAGLRVTVLLTFYGVAVSTFFNLPTFWLKLWTDVSSHTGRYDEYLYLGVYALFQILALVFLVMLAYHLLIIIVSKTGAKLHDHLLTTVANASLAFFSETDSGSITNRFSQDMQLIDMQLPLGLLNVTFAVFVVIGQIILVIASSPWIGVAFPVIFALLYMVQKFYLRTSRQLRFLDLEAKSPLYTNFLETLSGLPTLRAFGWTGQNLALSHKLLDASQKPSYLLYMIQRWLTFVLDMTFAVLATAIAALAVVQRANGGFTGIALTQVLLVNLTIRSLIVAWTEVETSIGAVSRVKNFSETTASEHLLLEDHKPAIDWPHEGRIDFTALTAIYDTAPDKPALNNLDLIIEPGEKIGVCGRSGSGKSSLVLALLRMLNIKSGTIKIDGLDLQCLSRTTIRERLNVIPQDSLFLPGTVRMNLDPRGQCNDIALVNALQKVQLWATLGARGGLDGELKDDLLSHGQRQLFCLAAATLRKARIVVLDEATSNVDHETDKLMQRIVREEFQGCTIIAVAHRLNTIMDFDRVAVLDHGVLCELDTPVALLARQSMFRSMWGEWRQDDEAGQADVGL
jgi:ATP-binding cassette subfamily C (CFTR/MRP) protein 1